MNVSNDYSTVQLSLLLRVNVKEDYGELIVLEMYVIF